MASKTTLLNRLGFGWRKQSDEKPEPPRTKESEIDRHLIKMSYVSEPEQTDHEGMVVYEAEISEYEEIVSDERLRELQEEHRIGTYIGVIKAKTHIVGFNVFRNPPFGPLLTEVEITDDSLRRLLDPKGPPALFRYIRPGDGYEIIKCKKPEL